jgi:hypothetical protein
MKTKKYYIVHHYLDDFDWWEAHSNGVLARLNLFCYLNSVLHTISSTPEGCEEALKKHTKWVKEKHMPKPKEVKMVEI